MAELLYDIWLHIISFLNSDEVWQLLSVNRTLFSIAMAEHYETTYIGFPPFRQSKQPRLQ